MINFGKIAWPDPTGGLIMDNWPKVAVIGLNRNGWRDVVEWLEFIQ